MKKYELTTNTKIYMGRTLFQIKALKSFGDVKEGELGGYIEKEENLSQDDNAWVSGSAKVYGDARVSKLSHLLVIGPIGSRDSYTTFFRNKDNDITVSCGCFLGNIEEFLTEVTKTHGNNKHAIVYREAVELAKTQIDLSEEKSEC